MLAKWREDKKEDSSREILVMTLKKCNLVEASGMDAGVVIKLNS